MIFTIKKNEDNTWGITPNSGPFQGLRVATAEGVDLTAVELAPGKAVGMIKAVWGLQFDEGLDVYSDLETVRGLGLGRSFKGFADRPVSWMPDNIYDLDSGRILRQTRRLVILGAHLFRRD